MDKFIYDLDVLKALVDIEISRIGRYEKDEQFAIVFIYSPKIAEENQNGQVDVASILKEKLRASDVVTGVVTFPENGKTSFELFQKLLEIMKENMLPSFEE